MYHSSKALSLKARKYNIFDAPRICFRCAPVAAFFYGLFDIGSAIIAPFRTLAIAGFIDAALNVLGKDGDLKKVYFNLGLIVIFAIYRWLEHALHNFADLKLVLSLRAKYRTALTEKRMRLEYHNLENAETHDLIERVAANPEGGRLKMAYFHLIDMAGFVLRIGGLLAILTSAVWWGGLAVVAISALSLVTGIRGGKKQYSAERAVAQHERHSNYLFRVLLGREAAAERELFSFNRSVSSMWKNSHDSAMKIRMKSRLRWYVSAYSGSLITLGSWIFIMLILLRPLQLGFITVGLFIALTQAFTNLNIVWGFMETIHGLSADSEFFKDLSEFMALDELKASSIQPGMSCSEESVSKPKISSLTLNGVKFRYPGTENWILDDLSYQFEPGRHYALVGANGAGKTTLIRLLTGLYPVDAGTIVLNGRNLADYAHNELLSHFSLVYQDFARYNLTLRDNIVFGNTREGTPLNEKRWSDLLSTVGLSETVARLPQGLDTPIGKLNDDGQDLSGGEWQRVAMARALAAPSPILILDEPTAALDPIAESQLYDLFDRATTDRTTLFISHRLGATQIADTILVLSDGKVIESGSHVELMRTGNLYRRMFDSQRSWYE